MQKLINLFIACKSWIYSTFILSNKSLFTDKSIIQSNIAFLQPNKSIIFSCKYNFICSIKYQLNSCQFSSLLQVTIDHRFRHHHTVPHHQIILQQHLHTVLHLRNIQHIILQAHQAILRHRQNIPQSKSN